MLEQIQLLNILNANVSAKNLEPHQFSYYYMETVSNGLETWVLVYNVTKQNQLISLSYLNQFGQIQRFYKAQGNLLFVKFQTQLAADLAILKRHLSITPELTIGITQIDQNTLNICPQFSQVLEHTAHMITDSDIVIYPQEKLPVINPGFIKKMLFKIKSLPNVFLNIIGL